MAERTGWSPTRHSRVKFTDVGEKCSIDAFLQEYDLTDPALLNDHEMLKHGMVDAFYAWCRSLQGEKYNWPPKM
jgi:hypothetical protein